MTLESFASPRVVDAWWFITTTTVSGHRVPGTHLRSDQTVVVRGAFETDDDELKAAGGERRAAGCGF